LVVAPHLRRVYPVDHGKVSRRQTAPVVVPSTLFQAGALLLFVVPGIVYAAVRRRLTGPVPDDREFSVRLIRAIAVSVVLDIVYALLVAPQIIRIARQEAVKPGAPAGLAAEPRKTALLALLLLVVIPGGLALLMHVRLRRALWPLRLAPIYHPTPTSWDRAAPQRGGCFVRIFTEDGYWVGGRVGDQAFVSTYPEPRDIFIDVEWRMGKDGGFVERVENSLGLYVPLSGKERVAWVWHPPDPAPPEPVPGNQPSDSLDQA
jgi:Family of unknown function (DUF6338)